MKVALIYCLTITGLCDASFIIQKMGNSEPARKSMKLRASSISTGRSLVNSVSTSGNANRKSRKNKSKNGGASSTWASSVNILNSVGSKNDFSMTKGHKAGKSTSYKTGKSFAMKPISSDYLRLSINKENDRKSRNSKKSSKKSKESRTSSVFTTSSSSKKSSKKPSKPPKHYAKNFNLDGFVYVTLPTNQWTEFFFSEVGQLPYSRWTFEVPADQKCTLQVVDSYCTGDRFEATRLLDSGIEIPILSTPPVMFNPVIAEQIRQGSNVTCNPFTTDAATAWASPDWSKGEAVLQPGSYKLILKSLLAPYGSGGAYVRLSCASPCTTPTTVTTGQPNPQTLCTYGSSGIKYIRQTLSFTQQANVCYSYGLRPFDATTNNIRDARNVLMNCAGVGTRAWIASYNGDDYRSVVGLSLHATQLSEVGAISASPDVSPLEGVLCQ